MKQRVIGASILLIVMVGSLLINSKLFGLLMVAFSILGFKEFFEIRYGKNNKKLGLIKFFCILCLLLITMNNTFYKIDLNVVILIPLLLLSLPIVFYNDNKLYNITDALYSLGIVYFLGFSFGNIIYMADSSLVKCIFIFIIAFITDTYAYIGGCLIGRHKLTSISPKKTIEGSVIGTIMGTVIGSVYYYNLVSGVTIFETVVLCLFLTF
jgi:phosphatidate cytidylyltransferase